MVSEPPGVVGEAPGVVVEASEAIPGASPTTPGMVQQVYLLGWLNAASWQKLH
jgi:hypothetical protein